jgi:hypothetical protein
LYGQRGGALSLKGRVRVRGEFYWISYPADGRQQLNKQGEIMPTFPTSNVLNIINEIPDQTLSFTVENTGTDCCEQPYQGFAISDLKYNTTQSLTYCRAGEIFVAASRDILWLMLPVTESR